MKQYHKFDVVIVGTGGAGLYAACELAKNNFNIAVISKMYPTRAHTGTAQGGIGAALGNVEEDHPQWHMFDTVKGSDYLADQDAVEILCNEAIITVIELEHLGLPFNRTTDGKIDQRFFGGHTHHFGQGPVRRSCYAADRTGHMILQTLYQQCIKYDVKFFSEFFVTDLLLKDNISCGVIAYEVATGTIHCFHSKAVLFATGGCGRIFKVTSNAVTLTGDGMAVVLNKNLPLEDMEFYQFHPTGIYKLGILLTEACRGEGGILRNKDGERFMERYAPTIKDLAPRDLVSRAIYTEIREGRGINAKDYVYLDLTHLGEKIIKTKLPDIEDFVKTYLGIDPIKELIPIQPTAHYAMGGIPTDLWGRVLKNEKNEIIPGFYAAGECACVSVHGANRLGTNSLVDILVFGKRAGMDIGRFIKENNFEDLPERKFDYTENVINSILNSNGDESPYKIREELQQIMMDNCGVFRTEKLLRDALKKIDQLKERFKNIKITDKSNNYNTELIEVIEIKNLIDVAYVTAYCALNRTESRGAHYREDYPKRNDEDWLKHTFIFSDNGKFRFSYKPVAITKFKPMERKY